MQNYPLLKGVQTNLYKCFMPLGWRLSGAHGVAALLHPEGPYDDPKGGALARSDVSAAASHFQFQNEFKLFPDWYIATKFSINVYGRREPTPGFDSYRQSVCAQHRRRLLSRMMAAGSVGGYQERRR